MSVRARLVYLLALFLVPVVVVATPSVAEAAETVVRGESASATVEGFSLIPAPGYDMSCNVSAQWVTPSGGSFLLDPYVEVGGVSCFKGWSFDVAGGECDSSDCSSMLVDLQGAGCSGSTSLPISYANGFESRRLTFPGGSATLAATCNVDTVCLTYDSYANNLPDDVFGPACSTLQLGLPASAETGFSCPIASIDTVTESAPSAGNSKYRTVTITGDVPDGSQWMVVRSLTGRNGSTGTLIYNPEVVTFQGGTATTTFGNISIASYPESTWGPQYLNHTNGVMLFPNFQPYYGYGTNDPRNLNKQTVPTQHNVLPPTGYYATQDMGACRFYFGDKLASVADSDTDEPLGGVGQDGTTIPPPEPPSDDPVEQPTPPEPDPAGEDVACGDFDFFKPSTWVNAGWCHVVAALKSVWDAVVDVTRAVGKVAGKVVDGIQALFVVSPGFVGDKVDSVKDRWSDTAPVVLADEVAGLGDAFQLAPAAGCAGPELAFSNPVGGGAVSLHPLSACGQYVSVLANLVKIALTVVVYVGAGFAALRMVGSAFGLDLSIDKSGE